MGRGRGRRAVAVLGAAGLVLAVAGCGSEQVDKAGGSAPRTLTLATHDDDYAYGTFAAAVERLSGGSMKIRVATNWRNGGGRREIDYERRIVADVRIGTVQLGIVGVRVWDTLGVDDFQALLAPFLVDSLWLERRALESSLAAHALESVADKGVVGIALLPGRLRRPLGITRMLLGPHDYRDAEIGIRLGGVAEATFRVLGAVGTGYVPGHLSGFDGTEVDALAITENDYDNGARALTGNVVFWPKPQTIVMNRKAFSGLTPQQQRILRDAGREALAPELARIAHDQRLGLSVLCSDGRLPIATATSADLAALRSAVQPVYDQIERDPFTKRWIAQIARMRATGPVVQQTLKCRR
jgi:TRAP-type C4-dicarboxylate transport system substrate-binding protein